MNYRKFVDNPVKITMVFLALVLLGVLSWRRLPVNLFPDVRTPRITLAVTTKDLGPVETERKLTRDFERGISSIKGVSDITTYSREGSIVIHVDFHWNTDMEFAFLDLKKNVGTMETREHVEQIDVYRFDPNSAPLVTLAFAPLSSGEEPDRINLTSLVENSLKPRFETIQGVAYVKAGGTREPEITVLGNEDLMSRYDLTIENVMQSLKNQNISVLGGYVIEGDQQMALKFVSRFENLDAIKNAVVKTVESFPVHLEDIAEVSITPSQEELIVRQDGAPTVSLDIYREPDANAILTARRIRKTVSDLNSRGNFGLKIAVDRSLEVESAVNEVIETALIGILLAMGVLWLFLRNIPATMIAAAAIPISITATFSLMYFQGLSLNIMTLGGLALGAGMLVDNAIVVIENIYRRKAEGDSPKDASVNGVREVGMAITAATITTIVVFVPLFYVHGIAGILFRDQALTVVYSLLMSLLVALLFIPMLTARASPAKLIKPGRINSAYGGFLKASLKMKWVLFVLFLALMLITWNLAKKLPSRFFPESVGGRISLLMELPPGTPLEKTDRAAKKMEEAVMPLRYRNPEIAPLVKSYERWKLGGGMENFLTELASELEKLKNSNPEQPVIKDLEKTIAAGLKDAPIDDFMNSPEKARQRKEFIKNIRRIFDRQIIIQSVTTTVGMESESVQSAGDRIFGPHTGRMEIVINPAYLREISARDLIRLLSKQASSIPDLKCSFESRNEFLQKLLGGKRGDVVAEVHAEELDELISAAERGEKAVAEIPGLSNVQTSIIPGETAYVLLPDKDALLRGGFSENKIAKQIAGFLQGEMSDKIKLDRGEMKIVMKSPRAEKEGLSGLMNLQMLSESGKTQRLENLVSVRKEQGLREIMRTDQERTLLVTADLNGISYEEAVSGVRKKMDALPWKEGSYWNISGEETRRRESFRKLQFALILAIVLVYMVIAAILESILHPLTIMLSVPLALAGVAGAFLITELEINIMGLIGVVMLTGIVVNDAIILLDRIRRIRIENPEIAPIEAVTLAGRQRLRPIVMTSLTTILALVPMALGYGNGAELRRPLAVAVIGGLFSSTLLTLWILPGLYLCMEDVIGFIKKIVPVFRGSVSVKEEAEKS